MEYVIRANYPESFLHFTIFSIEHKKECKGCWISIYEGLYAGDIILGGYNLKLSDNEKDVFFKQSKLIYNQNISKSEKK